MAKQTKRHVAVHAGRRRRRIVIKIGGKSLATSDLIRRAASLIAKESSSNDIVVVVSAPGETTSSLVSLLSGIDRGVDGRHWDSVLSYGEVISASILSVALHGMGVRSVLLDPRSESWPIITDRNFGDADPIESKVRALCAKYVEPRLRLGYVVVMPGFVGRTLRNEISTMGRGSSDLTAFLMGKCIVADEVVKVTDVDGIYVRGKRVDSMSRSQLLDLCHNGVSRYEKPYSIIQLKALDYFQPPTIARVVSYKQIRIWRGGTVIYPGEKP